MIFHTFAQDPGRSMEGVTDNTIENTGLPWKNETFWNHDYGLISLLQYMLMHVTFHFWGTCFRFKNTYTEATPPCFESM